MKNGLTLNLKIDLALKRCVAWKRWVTFQKFQNIGYQLRLTLYYLVTQNWWIKFEFLNKEKTLRTDLREKSKKNLKNWKTFESSKRLFDDQTFDIQFELAGVSAVGRMVGCVFEQEVRVVQQWFIWNCHTISRSINTFTRSPNMHTASHCRHALASWRQQVNSSLRRRLLLSAILFRILLEILNGTLHSVNFTLIHFHGAAHSVAL